MNLLQKAYQRLNKVEYKNIIKDTLIPILDEYDGEYVTTLKPSSVIIIQPHFHEGMYMGFNIYADGVLLESRETLKEAKEYLNEIMRFGSSPWRNVGR